MRTLLLPAIFALGVGLTTMASASVMIGPGITDKAAANFSPKVQQFAYDCRTYMKCNKYNRKCVPVQTCR